MTRGCIGSSPLQPTVAITIRTLEVYRQTHRVCPRLSIHAEAKKLCHLHNVSTAFSFGVFDNHLD